MEERDIIQRLENLVSKNRLSNLINILLQHVSVPEIRNQAIHISGQYHNLKQEHKYNSLMRDDYVVERNRIARALQELITSNQETLREIFAAKYKAKNRHKKRIFQKELSNELEKQYKIIREIASGPETVIYEAYDSYLNRKVAIKALKTPGVYDYDEIIRTVQGEISSVSSYKHNHIMTVYAASLNTEPKFILLEFINGYNLKVIIERAGALPLSEVKKIACAVGDALIYGHRRQFIHKGIMPENILIDEDGMPVITPFTRFRTRSISAPSRTQKHQEVMYDSPEQYYEEGPVTELSDQYALGLLIAEMIMGRPLFGGKTLREKREQRELLEASQELIFDQLMAHNCPEEFGRIIGQMLAYSPEARWPYLGKAIEAMRHFRVDMDKFSDLAKESYQRCRMDLQFTRLFYESFFKAIQTAYSPEESQAVKALFGRRLENQYKILNHAMDLILEPEAVRKSLKNLGNKHKDLIVNLKYLEIFQKTLVETAERCDPKWNSQPKIAQAWEVVTKKTVFHMKQGMLGIKISPRN